MTYRSTTLNLAANHCPRAVDFFEAGTPYSRDHFATGIAAHAFLEAAATGRDFTIVARDLLELGREFDGVPEPPLAAASVHAGRLLAEAWLAVNPIPDNAESEKVICVSEDWRPAVSERAYFKGAIDLVYVESIEDEDASYMRVTVRDYKTAWSAGEDLLDSLQIRGQVALAAALFPDAAVVRSEVVNLRTGRVYFRDLVLDDDGLLVLEGYRRMISAQIVAVDARADAGARPACPGAGCMGCPYIAHCEDARAYLRGTYLENDTSDIARAVGTRLAVVEAMRADLTAKAKLLAEHEPIRIDGGIVGYTVEPERAVVPDVEAKIARAWFTTTPELASNDEVIGLLKSLKIGVSAISRLAQVIFPSTRGSQAYKVARQEFESDLLITRNATKFGVHHE